MITLNFPHRLRLAVVAMAISLVAESGAEVPSYFFANFETEAGWVEGPLPQKNSAVKLAQGKAKIVSVPEPQSKQVLEIGPSEPYSAAFVDASPFAGNAVVYCELLARPVAIEGSREEEFLDFGGAILGCFRVGTQGEIRALYGKSATEGVWISTGIRFDLDAQGLPVKWLRIAIRLDQNLNTWTVWINETPAVIALRTTNLPSTCALPLWLFGDLSHGSRFDDLLISTVEPDALEKKLATHDGRDVFQSSQPGRQIVTRLKPNTELRRAQSPVPIDKMTARPRPILRGWNMGVDTGSQKLETKIRFDDPSDAPSILAYSPTYDDEGKRLPVVISMTADAELVPGADLSLLRWEVSEIKGWPDWKGKTIGHGDFRTGLVQTFTLSPEQAEKGNAAVVWTEDKATGE